MSGSLCCLRSHRSAGDSDLTLATDHWNQTDETGAEEGHRAWLGGRSEAHVDGVSLSIAGGAQGERVGADGWIESEDAWRRLAEVTGRRIGSHGRRDAVEREALEEVVGPHGHQQR